MQWLSNETPDRNGQGGQRRQFFQIKALLEYGHEVKVTSLAGAQDDTTVRQIVQDVHRVPRLEIRGLIPLPRRRRQLRRRLASWGDVAVVAHGESWERFAWALPPGIPALVDLHNVFSRWPAEESPEARERWSTLERRIRSEADMVAVTSAREAAALPDGRAPLLVAENGIDPQEWPLSPHPARDPVLKLFGNWNWAPNTRGLEWFVREVWPEVHDATGAQCVIAGSGADARVAAVAGVTSLGRVPDLQAFLADAWAVAVPLPESVGSPVKYAEALAVGCPVIATHQGAPGHRDLAVIADDRRVWVATLTQWLRGTEPPATLSAKDRRLRLERLSWGSATVVLGAWVARSGRAT